VCVGTTGRIAAAGGIRPERNVIEWLGRFGEYLWGPWTFFALLAAGIVFTISTRFSQYAALTHGTHVLTGAYDDPDHPGAISHFQALSAALSGTVGLGNIGGVALAISLGGPGALFWMWLTGFLGMAIKTVEVTLALMYRNDEDPRKPSGGAMWVVTKATRGKGPLIEFAGKTMGVIFCLTLLVSTITGGNIFQSWNVAEMFQASFGVNVLVTSLVMAVLVGMVVIGGIERIGKAAGLLVPVMCGLYLVASLIVLAVNVTSIPACLMLVVESAFSPNEAAGAFLGAGAYFGFQTGLKRALFSNEAGQGSAPIAHAAARTDYPAREGVVGGLEPFIDTLVICTLTALVILVTGTWNRPALGDLPPETAIVVSGDADDTRIATLEPLVSADELPAQDNGVEWREGDRVFVVLDTHAAELSDRTGNTLIRVTGHLTRTEDAVTGLPNAPLVVEWDSLSLEPEAAVPTFFERGVYRDLDGAPLTGLAFDSVIPGLGKWLVSVAAFLFALSTMISWCYYGEQGVVYLVGERGVLLYKLVFLAAAALAPVAAYNARALEVISDFGTGVMLWGNLPILFVYGFAASANFNDYMRRVRSGELKTVKQQG
jgi:AGCS family alanine or glycine:cation symporter